MGRAREGKGGSRGRHELQVRPQALQVTGEKPKAVSASAGGWDGVSAGGLRPVWQTHSRTPHLTLLSLSSWKASVNLVISPLSRDHPECHIWNRAQLCRLTPDTLSSQRQVPSQQTHKPCL